MIAGRYATLGELGRGGMGVVWLAEDRTIGRRVAIKELHLPDGVSPGERTVFEERVLREARAAGRLNDPGVVTVYDVVQEAGTTFIVMELIQATTLSALVGEQGPLPQAAVARLAEQLLSALAAAHAAGVVHRDVKPSNIMVLPNGRVKLTDFGIAQSTDDPRLTTSGILIGSPVYMAPERLRGADADAGSDLWALGAVLFFAVEGYTAFERASTAATMHAILTEVPFLTRCHGPLASVIMGLLNTHPEARPSADQVRGLLGQATNTPPEGLTAQLAGPPTMRQAPPAAPRRKKGPILWLAAALAVALFAGGFGTRIATEPDSAGDRPAAMAAALTYGDGGYLQELTISSYPPGGCVDNDLDKGRRIVDTAQVDCAEPHVFQVYETRTFYKAPAEYETYPDIEYPGADGLSAYAESICELIFDSAKVTGDRTGLQYRALVPTRQAWDESRDVYCVLYRADGDQMTKSMVPLE
jgi:hypothetical protein